MDIQPSTFPSEHVNTTTFEQQLASCALTPATFIDNFGSVRSVAKPDLDLSTMLLQKEEFYGNFTAKVSIFCL